MVCAVLLFTEIKILSFNKGVKVSGMDISHSVLMSTVWRDKNIHTKSYVEHCTSADINLNVIQFHKSQKETLVVFVAVVYIHYT